MQDSLKATGKILALVSLLCLSACNTLPKGRLKSHILTPHTSTSHTSAAHNRHLTEIGKHKSFTAAGRVGITSPKEGFSAGFLWKQNPNGYQIRLAGPVDAGSVEIEGSHSGVTLTQNNGRQYVATSPEVLIHKVMGIHLPVSGLNYWLQGVPVPGEKAELLKTNQHGHILQMNQQGWHIEYTEYHHNTYYKIALPKRVILKKDKLTVKFFIREWKDL